MSYTRQIGYLVDKKTHKTPVLREQIKGTLGLTDNEMLRLNAGRLFLNCQQQETLFSLLNVSLADVLSPKEDIYSQRVHCMSAFSNTGNLDLVLDLIDAFIDAKESERTK